MKRTALMTLCLLLLCGCSTPFSLPRATEPRNLAQVSVMGVDAQEGLITAYAATQGRGGNPIAVFRGSGDSLAAARLETRDQGTQNVSYAHVEDIVLSEGAASEYLSSLLRYSFQNREQSMECRLWVLRDAPLAAVFHPEQPLASRLVVLKTGSEAGTSLPGCTLRQATARLTDDGSLLLPALTCSPEGTISFDGYALFRDGAPVGYVEGTVARSAAVLSGASCYWTGQVTTAEGEAAVVQLHSRGSSVRPLLENGRLRGLAVTVKIDGQLFKSWSNNEIRDLEAQVEALVAGELGEAVSVLQTLGADGAGLRRQAGLSALRHWETIKTQWAEVFPSLPVSVTVEARVNANG